MAKRVRDAVLDSPTARAKLKPSPKPYFRAIDRGLHLGYRRGKRGGTWVARRYLGGERYAVEALGTADDWQDADGVSILTFNQAQDRARARLKEAAEAERLAALGPAVSVKQAIEEYLVAREAREREAKGEAGLKRDARSRLTKHVLSDEAFAAKALQSLTTDDLATVRDRLQAGMKGGARRTVNDLKAALNAAARRHAAQLPPTLSITIKNGLATREAAAPIAREKQILPDADVRALIAAAGEIDREQEWEGDLARMVIVLAATGARFSQVARMTVADVQAANGRLMVPVSSKGRGAKAVSRIAVRVGPDVLAALKPATAGRKGPEPLLLRPRWQQVSTTKWEKAGRAQWGSASELTRPWGQIVVRAGLPADTVPYSLRHSSIVRGLRAGLPVRLVAALHDTSSAMIEKHYAAYIVDAMDELAARAIVPLTSSASVELRSVR